MADKKAASFDVVTTPGPDASLRCPRCGSPRRGGSAECATCTAVPSDDGGQADPIRERLQAAIGKSFTLLELLGRGGMGIVFRARETALDREVALKVLTLDPVLAPDAFARFEREAKLAARLDHPNIVPIFAVGHHASVAYYTMRLVKGGSVEDMMSSRTPLDTAHVIAVLRDVAAALDYAHRNGIVHRDIKPANILIGESGHAMVADFGIAKAFGAAESATSATGTGIIGSPGYMSPEQWRGEEVSGRADQYALGIVAFEMLAGRRPFESPRIQDLVKMHTTAAVPSLSQARGGLGPEVDDAIRRALSKYPSERFSSAGAFVEALAGKRSVSQTGRAPRATIPLATAPRRRVLLPALVVLLAGTTITAVVPQTRDPTLAFWARATARAEELATTGLPPEEIAPPSRADSAGRDSASMLAEPPADSAIALPAALPELARRPIGVDSTGIASSFRRIARAETGWLRVITQGGSARVRMDGRTFGFTPQFLRVEPGEHVVTVEGAGDTFFPSQVIVSVTAGDTSSAVFSTPSAAAQERDRHAPPRTAPPASPVPAANVDPRPPESSDTVPGTAPEG